MPLSPETSSSLYTTVKIVRSNHTIYLEGLVGKNPNYHLVSTVNNLVMLSKQSEKKSWFRLIKERDFIRKMIRVFNSKRKSEVVVSGYLFTNKATTGKKKF